MLQGSTIVLRPFQTADWERSVRWRNDLQVKGLSMMHPFPVYDELERAWYEARTTQATDRAVYFSIVEKEEGEHIGFIWLHSINWVSRTCRLAIVIGGEAKRGRGHGTEAMRLIMQHAFGMMNLRKITLEVVAFNTAAIHVYEKVGFVHEGRLKAEFHHDGQYHDVCIMSAFKEKA